MSSKKKLERKKHYSRHSLKLISYFNDFLYNEPKTDNCELIFDDIWSELEANIDNYFRANSETLLHFILEKLGFNLFYLYTYDDFGGETADYIEFLEELFVELEIATPVWLNEANEFSDLQDLLKKARTQALSDEVKSKLRNIYESTFFTLWQHHGVMYDLNFKVSEIITSLRKEKFPQLSSDGVVERQNPLPDWLKKAVKFRDSGQCQKCGVQLFPENNDDVSAEYDHIVPLKKGGTNDPTNIQLYCDSCNNKKGISTKKINTHYRWVK